MAGLEGSNNSLHEVIDFVCNFMTSGTLMNLILQMERSDHYEPEDDDKV